MKKILLLVVAAMMATMSANAQNGYDNTKHEVALSYGYLSNSQWLDAAFMSVNLFSGLNPVKGSAYGPISAEYFCHINNWLGVGAIFSFGQISTNYDSMANGTEVYTKKNTNFTLMPAVKFDWFRREHIGLYSKIGVGVLLCNMKTTPADPAEMPTNELVWGFNWQVSAIGFEFGGPQLRGFIEGGMGEQGVALVGIRYKF